MRASGLKQSPRLPTRSVRLLSVSGVPGAIRLRHCANVCDITSGWTDAKSNNQTHNLKAESWEATMSDAAIRNNQMDSTTLVGGVAVVAVAVVTGLWQWLGGKKKQDADASTALVSGFVTLLAEFKSERVLLIARVNELEETNQQLDRRIAVLEALMIKGNIAVPEEARP